MDIAGCSLAELVNDPLICVVMKSDGVDRRQLEHLLERITRERLQPTGLAKPCRPQPQTAGTLP
jgi:hypothetical protein